MILLGEGYELIGEVKPSEQAKVQSDRFGYPLERKVFCEFKWLRVRPK